MKKARYTESQIFKILKEAESGIPVPELCRKHGMSDASFYKWRAKYGGMDVSSMTRLRELEEENRRLKTMYAESRMDCEILREAMRRTFKDQEFLAEYKKIIREDFEPIMAEEVEKAIREIPRDPEVNELVKKLSGPGPMPSRS